MAAKRARSKRGRANLLTSLALVFPLFLFYEVGVQLTGIMNGADFVTTHLTHLAGHRGFLIVQGALLVSYLGLLLYLSNREEFHPRLFLPILVESGLYALTMGTLILFVMVDLLKVDPRLAASAVAGASIFARLVIAAGAGVYEELVFRLVLLGGLVLVGERSIGLTRWASVLGAFLVSSILFSLAHHIGPFSEPLRLGVFLYRTLAGLVFASLFQFRSFAIAVYTHALYDTYVLLFPS